MKESSVVWIPWDPDSQDEDVIDEQRAEYEELVNEHLAKGWVIKDINYTDNAVTIVFLRDVKFRNLE